MSDAKRWQEHQDRWARERLEPALERAPERKARFITQSGVEIERVYTPADLADPSNDPDAGRPRYRFSQADAGADGWDVIDDLGLPGEPPFTRGIHPTGHRGRLWTMRMFAGFGTAEDTNDRFKKLIAAGELIVIEVEISPTGSPSSRISMSASDETATPQVPNSPSAIGSSWS